MTVTYYQRLTYDHDEGMLSDPKGLGFWLHAYTARDLQLTNCLIVDYLCGNTIPDCLDGIDALHERDADAMMDWFVGSLRRATLDELVKELRNKDYALVESTDNVPQLSSLEGSTVTLVDILAMAETPLTYVRIGYHLYGSASMRNETAKRKYGENAAKFAALLGLVRLGHDIKDPSAPNRIAVELTRLGRAVSRAKGDRMEIVARLLLKVALFRDLLCSDSKLFEGAFWSTILELSQETRRRRTSAFSAMLGVFGRYGGTLTDEERIEELLCRMRH